MNELIQQISQLTLLTQQNIPFLLTIMGVLLVIEILNQLLHYRLNRLGIYPRHPFGLIGIFCSPWLHGSFSHLFFNAIPLFVLANFVLLQGHLTFFYVTGIVMIVSGLGIWLFGRPGFHVGASTLIMGYWGYLILNAFQQTNVINVIIVIITLYYFSGLLIALIPTRGHVSFEGHLFGFLGGIVAKYVLQVL